MSDSERHLLTDWERRQWAALAEQLSADPGLARADAPPSKLSLGWHRFQRRFYPAGYLASALGYMVLAMGGALTATFFGVTLVATVSWIVVRWLAGSRPPSPRGMWRRLDAR